MSEQGQIKITDNQTTFLSRNKLIIQIPCYNEAASIAACIENLPRQYSSFDRTEILVVDDGSSDDTVHVARRAGANHVLSLGRHRGLAHAFREGLLYSCMHLQADVVVNYDADRQYIAEDIPLLLEPICRERADYVVGVRPIRHIQHMSVWKRILQITGSFLISRLFGATISDVTSGFRALNREAGLRLSIWGGYTYTIETIIHALDMDLTVVSVPIRVSPTPTRPSRLVQGNFQYCTQAIRTVLMTLVRYQPFQTFSFLALVSLTGAIAIGLRFLWYFAHHHVGNTQSLILCAILAISSLSFILAAILGEEITISRRIMEQIRFENRSLHRVAYPGSRV